MVLKLEADRMSGILLDGNTLETERKVIIEEYHTYMNNPVAKAFFEFRKSFYGEHPYAIGPLGIIEDIQAVSREDCLSYFNDNYSPSNAVVVIAGDIGDDAGVFDMVNRHFGGLKGSPSQARGLDICPAGGKPGYMKRIVDFDVPMVILGFPAPESSSADALPLDMMQMIVSQGESGRLHREVVRRRAVAVMAGGMNHFLRLSGMSLFFAAFTPDTSSKKVIKALEEQIERVRRDGIEPREIEKIRNTMVTNRAFDMYSADHICQRLGYSETVDGDYRIWIKRMHAINTIEPSTLLSVAKKYWAPEGRCTLYLKPRKMKPVLFLAGMARKLFTKR
jgi:predicted Zn-dependent peptidase